MQKIQNKAIRICLSLPRYVSIRLLHESACLPLVKERLCQLGARTVAKMRQSNPLVRGIVEKKEADNVKAIQSQGLSNIHRSHRSLLDIILPVQRPIPSSPQS